MKGFLETTLIRLGQAIFLGMLIGGVVLLCGGWLALI